jgi:hypothetical protein
MLPGNERSQNEGRKECESRRKRTELVSDTGPDGTEGRRRHLGEVDRDDTCEEKERMKGSVSH